MSPINLLLILSPFCFAPVKRLSPPTHTNARAPRFPRPSPITQTPTNKHRQPHTNTKKRNDNKQTQPQLHQHHPVQAQAHLVRRHRPRRRLDRPPHADRPGDPPPRPPRRGAAGVHPLAGRLEERDVAGVGQDLDDQQEADRPRVRAPHVGLDGGRGHAVARGRAGGARGVRGAEAQEEPRCGDQAAREAGQGADRPGRRGGGRGGGGGDADGLGQRGRHGERFCAYRRGGVFLWVARL